MWLSEALAWLWCLQALVLHLLHDIRCKLVPVNVCIQTSLLQLLLLWQKHKHWYLVVTPELQRCIQGFSLLSDTCDHFSDMHDESCNIIAHEYLHKWQNLKLGKAK